MGKVAALLRVERTNSTQQQRSRKSFPSKNDGRDGDKVSVVNSSGTWECTKVRGRWRRVKVV